MNTQQNSNVHKLPASEPPKYYNVSSAPHMAYTYGQYNGSYTVNIGQVGTYPNYTNVYGYPTSYPIGQPAMAYKQQYQYQPAAFNIVGPSTNQNLMGMTSRKASTKTAQTSESVENESHVEKKTDPEMEKLLKKVRSLLEKITPETFDKATKEFFELEPLINTVERCTSVVEIVFQKAIGDSETCAMYAELCHRMIVWELPRQYAQPGSALFTANKHVSFRRALLGKCQSVFDEYLKFDEAAEINGMPELKKQLQDDVPTEERSQFLGNVRFIGELYNRSALTETIMLQCISRLLCKANKGPEALESLCALLTVIAKRLEITCNTKSGDIKTDLNGYYAQLKALAQKHQLAVRYRLMILDLLALRTNHWKPLAKHDGRRDGQWNYSREFMCAVAKVPLANVRPQFDTTKWSTDNFIHVFHSRKMTKNQKRKQRNIPTTSNQDQGRKTGGCDGPPEGCGSQIKQLPIVDPQVVVDLESHPGNQAEHLEPETEAQLDKPWADVCARLSKLEEGIVKLDAKIDHAIPSCGSCGSTAASSVIVDQGITAGFSSKQPTKVHMVISSGTRECTTQTDPIDEREQIIRLLHKNPELIDFVKTYIRAVED